MGCLARGGRKKILKINVCGTGSHAGSSPVIAGIVVVIASIIAIIIAIVLCCRSSGTQGGVVVKGVNITVLVFSKGVRN